MEQKVCEWCGAPIAPHRNARYCDSLCYGAAYRQAQREKNKIVTGPRACRACGKEFIPAKSVQVYCCKECYRRYSNCHHNPPKKTAAAPKPVAPPNLNRTMRELEAYNKEHGTYISYGQWMGGVR